MSKSLIAGFAGAVLIASVNAAGAYPATTIDVDSLSGRAAAAHPGVMGTGSARGASSAKPGDNSLSGQVMRNLPSNRVGTTAKPLARPDDGSLSGKAMHDHPGNS